MNNTLTAKLSKLVYTTPDNPDLLFKIGEFDRLVLLVRRLYQILDEQNALSQLTLCIRRQNQRGLIVLDGARADSNAATIRMKRWHIYTQIAERMANRYDRISVTIENNETANLTQLEQYYLDIADKTVALFGLKEAKLQQQKYPEDKTQQQSILKKLSEKPGQKLSMINTKVKIEQYAANQTQIPLKIARQRFIYRPN
ncbi:amino acid permease [Neisseria cinerea]|jgi:hypothetical protein|uniref:amino acid permease n=2 Tax=Neisseria cinerea TaxID=483 RepID=UPI0027E204FD|nr:amino acid permease [Neisseria cinerea]